MIYATISPILMKREEDVVTAPVDIVTFTAEDALWYYVYAKTAIAFTYFTINCKFYLNIGIAFDVNMCKPKILFCLSPLA